MWNYPNADRETYTQTQAGQEYNATRGREREREPEEILKGRVQSALRGLAPWAPRAPRKSTGQYGNLFRCGQCASFLFWRCLSVLVFRGSVWVVVPSGLDWCGRI